MKTITIPNLNHMNQPSVLNIGDRYHFFTCFGDYFVFDKKTIHFFKLSQKIWSLWMLLTQKNGLTEMEGLFLSSLLSLVTKDSKELSNSLIENSGTVEVQHYTICLILTHQCNMSCTYCYDFESRIKFGEQDLPFDQIIDVIHQAASQYHELVIWFFGGEPLLKFDTIKRTVEYCNQLWAQGNHSFQYSITTNGTLLTEEIIRFFKENHFSILLSNDGFPENNAKQRPVSMNETGASYLSPDEAMLLALNSQIDPKKLAIRATYTGESIVHLIDTFRHFREMGIKKILFAPAIMDHSQMTQAEAETWMAVIEDLIYQIVHSLDLEGIRFILKWAFVAPNLPANYPLITFSIFTSFSLSLEYAQQDNSMIRFWTRHNKS